MKKIFLLVGLLVCLGISAEAQRLPSVSILGDSYSTFEGYLQPDTNSVWYWEKPADESRTDVESVRQTWWHRLIRENGYRLCVNNSYSGATISNTGYKDEKGKPRDFTDRSFVTRVSSLGCPDIIFIFGATNDSWAGVPIGEYKYADWTKQDLYNFRPAMACLLEKVADHYPNVDIYFLLNDGLRPEINESVKTVCKHYAVPCIELQNIDKKSGHPSVLGMEQICNQIKAFLKTRQK